MLFTVTNTRLWCWGESLVPLSCYICSLIISCYTLDFVVCYHGKIQLVHMPWEEKSGIFPLPCWAAPNRGTGAPKCYRKTRRHLHL